MIVSKDEIMKSVCSYGWIYQNKAICKKFKFKNYMEGINFVNLVAEIAEKRNHHPDIAIGWCEVNLNISSHDLGGVTTHCINLAMDIDLLNNNG